MSLIHRIEPLLWMIFGAGGFLAAIFLPGLIVGVLLLGSDLGGLSYDRVHAMAASLPGKIFLISFFSLVLWHCMHHLRHLLLDLLGHGAAAAGAWVSYALAIAGTVATISAVSAL